MNYSYVDRGFRKYNSGWKFYKHEMLLTYEKTDFGHSDFSKLYNMRILNLHVKNEVGILPDLNLTRSPPFWRHPSSCTLGTKAAI